MMNVNRRENYQNEKGIALLVAIIFSGAILGIGLSISTIASRSHVVSTAVRESQLAYYAGEAGSECARYWASKDKNNFSPGHAFTISCDGEDFSWDETYTGNTFHLEFDNSYFDPYLEEPFNYPYFSSTTVERQEGAYHINVESKGYNTQDLDASRRYEREQTFVEAYGISSYKPDIMLVVDISSSVDTEEMGLLVDSLIQFIDILNPTPEGAHVGIVVFSAEPKLHLHLTGNKNLLISSIENVADISGSSALSNLQEGLRYAHDELSNRVVAFYSNSSAYCPLPGGPNRAVVTFSPSIVNGTNPTISAQSPQPIIPPGNYNIYVATCDTWENNTTLIGRETETQPGERVQLELYNNPGLSGTPFFQSNPTDDVPDLVRSGAINTLVAEDVVLADEAQGYKAIHYSVPACGGGCDNSVVPACAMFETTDGSNLNFATMPGYDSHDRPDEESPDYIIVLSDGPSTAYRSCLRGVNNNSTSIGSDNKKALGLVKINSADNSINPNENSIRQSNAQGTAQYESELHHFFDINTFVIGINTLTESCPDYTSCSDFLNQEIASYGEPNGFDSDGNAFYFDSSFDALDDSLIQLIGPTGPLSGGE